MVDQPLNIGVSFWLTQEFGRQVAAGLIELIDTDPGLTITTIPMGAAGGGASHKKRDLDALIAIVEQNEIGRYGHVNMPLVFVPRIHEESLGWVNIGTDGFMIGRMAARHLASLRLSQFAVWVPKYRGRHDDLVRGFCEPIAAAGGRLLPTPATDDENEINNWVRHLPAPCGVLCAFDTQIRQFLRAAIECDKKVPGDFAVIAATNDPFACLESEPPVSSIVPATRKVSEAALEQVRKLVEGQEAESIGIAPVGVDERRSTEMVAIADHVVAKAVHFMRQRFGDAIGTEDIAEAVGMSRRALEYRFRDAMGCGIHEELVRYRLSRAKTLLAYTDLPIKQVAYAVGYPELSNFNRFINLHTDQSPTKYRKSHGDAIRPNKPHAPNVI